MRSCSRHPGPTGRASEAGVEGRSSPDIRERFGFAVKDRREAPGLTQEEIAERAGIHRTYLWDVERGTRTVSLVNIERVTQGLSMKFSELFQVVEKSR